MVNDCCATPLLETVELWVPTSVSFFSHTVSNFSGICDRLNSFSLWDIGEIVSVLFIIRDQGLDYDPKHLSPCSNKGIKSQGGQVTCPGFPGLLVLACLNPRPSCFCCASIILPPCLFFSRIITCTLSILGLIL